MEIFAATALIMLTGPEHQPISVNPAQIVTTRSVRPSAKEDFARGIRCLVHTTDGKFISVVETCDDVRKKMEVN
jgi:hypothetical protein